MGIETPLALLGLLSVLIPVLAHRMRNRELPHVVLPTFALLTRAAAKSQHKRALSDLLLLCVRIALVALASIALAAPFVSARLSFGDGQVANVLVVIDDSLSMARRESGTPLIELARARALEVLSALPEGSELGVVLGGKPARVLLAPSRDLGSARRTLENAALRPTRSNDLNSAVELAWREQTRGGVSPKRMLVLSDFARHATLDPDALPLDAAAVSFERIGSAPDRPNLFIAGTHASVDPSRPLDTSIAVEVHVAPANADTNALPAARAELEVDRNVVSSAALSFEHGVAKTVLHATSPDPSQSVEARVRIAADDALSADNQVSLVLGHADALQVLMVNGDPRPSSRGDELYYASRALALLPESELSLRVQSVDPISFEHADLNASDVIVLANAPVPSAELAARLTEFVRSGGGLIVAAGARVEAAGYNAQLGALLPNHVSGVAPCAGLHLTLGDAALLPEGLAGLREVRAQQRLLVEQNPGVETLLRFEDGVPALTARSQGEGRSLLLALALDTDFSDLPLRPGFLPLLAAMIQNAAGPKAATRSRVAPGESVALPAPPAGHYLEVIAPDGRKQRFTHVTTTEAARFADTDSLGVFEIRAGRDGGDVQAVRATFVVDPPHEESDLTPGALPQTTAHEGKSAPAAVSVHKPLSPGILLSVFALAVLDGLLRMRKRWRPVS
jgi:hypothetical protein